MGLTTLQIELILIQGLRVVHIHMYIVYTKYSVPLIVFRFVTSLLIEGGATMLIKSYPLAFWVEKSRPYLRDTVWDVDGLKHDHVAQQQVPQLLQQGTPIHHLCR